MRLCRYGNNRIGVVRGDYVHDVTGVLDRLGPYHYPLPTHDVLIAALDHLRSDIEALAGVSAPVALSEVRLQSPVANPGKLIAAPVNYQKHLEEARGDAALHHQNQIGEIQRVGLFLKATSSMVGPDEGVVIRFPNRRNDHEVELAVVIGKTADRVPVERALHVVAGYCIGLDMTVRGPEERSLRKSIDSYSVLGPWLVTADELGEPVNLELSLAVNGEIRQAANTRDLILSVPELIAFASSYYTLHPGDILFSGTPAGVGPVQPGDVIRASIDRIGEIAVSVRGS
jgi:2,4-didehydro-3-deoxy-L-rhamnonate hydrolase